MIPNVIKILSLFTTILFFSCNNINKQDIVSLNESWKFYYEDDGNWYSASVCGNIHNDLFANNLIQAPYYSSNADSLTWISSEAWTYKKEFNIYKSYMSKNIDLIFDGLDTHAQISLNGEFLGSTQNMYRQWIFPINNKVKEGSNILEVTFKPSSEYNAEKQSTQAQAIPDDRVFSRKAPYQYGWDWGPNLETCGIYKNVYLKIWDKAKIENVRIDQKELSNTLAQLTANFTINSENICDGRLIVESTSNEFNVSEQIIVLEEGINTYDINFEIKNPELWWCNGMGDQKLYEITFRLETQNSVDEKTIKYGVRKLEFASDLDKDGQEFYFILNDVPIFAKGANWIPADYFNGENSYEKYRSQLELAKEANFNMLRVWGGGIYENDDFYRICDSLGIMVWQDFMFACAMYPLDDNMIINIKEEVNYQVNRLHNYTSIVLWCGNNEISNGWFDWGWQKQFNLSKSDSIRIWNDYDTLFHKIIPNEIAKIDKSREYIPSSPLFGWGHDEHRTHGDSHYWGVWWGMLEFDAYYENTGRFMSEYGFQGLPSMKSLKKFIPQDSLFLFSESIKSHQKHPFGFKVIEKEMSNEMPKPKDFEDYVYLSQILQAKCLQTAFDAHLEKMPFCMGSLFWQFNDCWPVISWSAIDYYEDPKASYYTAKNSFENIHLSSRKIDNEFILSVTNHSNKSINTKLALKQIRFDGKLIQSHNLESKIDNLSTTKVVLDILESSLLNDNKTNSYFIAELFDFQSNKLIGSRLFILDKEKNLDLEKSDIDYEIEKKSDHWEISLRCNTFVKSLYLEINEDGFLSDNYFDLEPNKTKKIRFYQKNKTGEINIKFKSLNEIITLVD